MYFFVLLVFLFGIGAMFGWAIEVLYRHFADKEKRWFNPGFCIGPWLPIYGIGLTILFLMTYLEDFIPFDSLALRRIVLFLIMSLIMTLIELIGGAFLLKYFNLRLWDYSDEFLNYKGFICLKFSLMWMLLGAVYYFIIHHLVYEQVLWLSKNLIFSFFVGMFFGVFMIDLIYSSNVIKTVKQYALDNNIIVKLEEVKDKIAREKRITDSRAAFFIFMLKDNIAKVLLKKDVE